jgi:hypothetical protein
MTTTTSSTFESEGQGVNPSISVLTQVSKCWTPPTQVGEHDLPSSPLKETEKRANDWFKAWGTEQTEIDALATLRPELLDQIARDAIEPFFDSDLKQRVAVVRNAWKREAQEPLEDQLDEDVLERVLDAVAELQDAVEAVELPALPAVPRADLDGAADYGTPLIDSTMGYAEQTRRLKESKAYEDAA